MDYHLFTLRLGKLDYPTDEQREKFIEGQDSVHCVIHFGAATAPSGKKFFPDISDASVNRLFWFLDLIKSRGAVRGRDYIITCHGYHDRKNEYDVGVHTTHEFFGLEDHE